MDFFTEIAKLRAARLLWAKIVKKYNPPNPQSLALRTHCQTSGWSLTEQDAYNNVSRTCVEALAAVFGGTQSLHTNALDEALGLPTNYSAKIARDTQLVLQNSVDITQSIDPCGGSFRVEILTYELARQAWAHIEEIESLGGMAKAIEAGLPKMRIEESAARKQARIDSGHEVIIGVNQYVSSKKPNIEILEVNNEAVRNNQVQRLDEVKKSRNKEDVDSSLRELTQGAKQGEANLLELAVEAARARATLGEISQAMEEVFTRHQAKSLSVSGVYSAEISMNPEYKKAQDQVLEFERIEGRRPRILVAKMGQDGHDRGAKIIATSFADLGFDVDIGPLFQTPDEVAKQAAENDVHIVGISSLAGAHKTLVPQLRGALQDLGRGDIMIVVGGVIPPQDYDSLYQHGVSEIFGPGTVISVAALSILEKLLDTETR